MCYSSLIVIGSPSSDSSVSSSFKADAGGSSLGELSVNNNNTSQTTHHDGMSLSEQHTTDLLLCHGTPMNAAIYAWPLPEATSTTVHKWHNLYSM